MFAVQALFLYGIGLLLATLTAHFRDMPQFVSIALQLWFWVTPIVYLREQLAGLMSFAPALLAVNPLYHLTNLYQTILYRHVVLYDTLPNTLLPADNAFLGRLAGMAALGLALVVGASFFYNKRPDLKLTNGQTKTII